MAIKIGDAAPDFTLFDSEKNEQKLSDRKGKNVVLLFFPLAFTGVCTDELCYMRDNYSKYEGLNAEILAISADSVFVLGKYKEEQNYNFPLLSDFNKETATAYGSLYDSFVLGMKHVPKRSAFVIDKAGVVQYAEVLEDAGKQPNFEAIQATLEKLA